ncbi:heterokaryon incompatibility protein-domain-containing protein [Nemania sp. FL0916]|nr:heterokaryon incompatibility protein-domain-containing protein [Nemania sp. FL0916]
MNSKGSGACACRNLHFGCNVATCEQAQYAKWRGNKKSLKQYRRCATERGCQTCGCYDIIQGITEDEEEIEITIESPDRRLTGGWFLRTRASENSQHWRHFDLWQDLATMYQNDSCKAFQPRICQPVQGTYSPQSLGHLEIWLRKCNETHPRSLKDDIELPTRLLKTTEGEIRVVETEEGVEGRYMTLSHRWGADETFNITRELKISYIWIDSLCIIQDDLEDWERESVRMRTIYGNSYLNIAGCHPKDSSESLFSLSDLKNRFPTHPVPGREATYIRQQPHMTHTDYGMNYSDFDNQQVLLSRGWVLQERLLSPRIVYYDADELKWECNMALDCQCGGMGVIANFKLDYMAALEGSDAPRELSLMWMRTSQRYSCLRLTYDTDRVVALAGIANQASKSGDGGKYLAGLWEHNLAFQLCWEIVDTYRKAETYLAPSWSWLSVIGSVNFFQMGLHDNASLAVEVTEAECTTANNDTGAITGGHLKVKGKWIRLLAKIENLGSETTPPTCSYRLVYAETADYVMSAEQAVAIQDVLVVFWGRFYESRIACLILKEHTLVRGSLRGWAYGGMIME